MEITTAEQNSFVESILFEHGPLDKVWMGGSDVIVEGEWLWAVSKARVSAGFTSWAPGEPDDWKNHQDCMSFKYQWKHWDDDHCAAEYPFICQRLVSSVIG